MGIFGGTGTSTSLNNGCFASSTVPGRTIEKVIGLVQFTEKGVGGEIDKVTQGAFVSLLATAKANGANAVVNVRLAIGSYEKFTPNMQVSYLIAYGDAVVLSEPIPRQNG